MKRKRKNPPRFVKARVRKNQFGAAVRDLQKRGVSHQVRGSSFRRDRGKTGLFVPPRSKASVERKFGPKKRGK